jgi:hypothetical protein
MKKFLTTKEAAKKRGVCKQRLLALLAQHRIPGAKKHGPNWMIPEDFEVAPSEKRSKPLTKLAKPPPEPGKP